MNSLRTIIVGCFCFLAVGSQSLLFADSTVKEHKTDEERMDSIAADLPYLERKVLSTLMFGASTPVSVTGEARLKGQFHRFTHYPDYLGPHIYEDPEVGDVVVSGDRSYLNTGWEEGMFRLEMIVHPGRNTVLWSRFALSHTFPGNRVTNLGDEVTEVQIHHDQKGWEANLYEDMCAGIAIRTVPASFWLKMGNILWTEGSPFTIWKGQPRVFAWEYLPYEEERSISEYFAERVAVGETEGRAAWNKKAFNGINLESITLPHGFYLDLVYGKFGEYDKFEREGMDFATDLAYAAEGDSKLLDIIETGYGDSYRHIFHARLAKTMKTLTLGLNYNNIHASQDIIYAQNPAGIFFNNMFDLYSRTQNRVHWATESQYIVRDSLGDTISTVIAPSLPSEYEGYAYDSVALDCGKGFYKEPKAYSIDFKGSVGTQFDFHADIGLSNVDTTWVYGDTTRTGPLLPLTVKKTEKTSTGLIPAFYANLKYKAKISVAADIAYISKGFYSPFSFASPMDAFFAFGTNMLGAGTFIGPTENSPYVQNMAGVQLTVAPKLPGYGHLRMKYGQHFQPEKGRDLLFFPYRLNGMDFNSVFMSTYAKWGSGTVDFPFSDVKYDRRLGDESYAPTGHIDESPDKGGLRADYLNVFEGFVPYDNGKQALLNYSSSSSLQGGSIDRYRENSIDGGRYISDNGDTVVVSDTTMYHDDNGFVPMHQKYTYNVELDFAHDIGPLIRYKREFFLNGYCSFNGVTTRPMFVAFDPKDDDVLLWSRYFRFEPVVALTNKFYVIGLLGHENWQSNKAWMNVNIVPEDNSEAEEDPILKRVPINYTDVAYGLGFDWDMLSRVGLHARVKKMKHTDAEHSENDHKWFLISMEIKMFF